MRLLPLLWLAACAGNADDGPKYVEETGDTYIPWPDDTDPPGTDEDGDGVTVEDGDCDDNNIYVNPNRQEDTTDGIDNDCDGRIDEVFHGLIVLQQGDGSGPARILGIDDFGNQEWEVLLDNADLVPYFMTPRVGGDGWVIGILGSYDGSDPVQIALYEVDSSGNTSLLADFSDADVYEFGMYGLATHPDGYYLVTTGDAVNAVEPGTGSVTPLQTWDPETELYAFDVAVDELSGDAAVFGYYGGFATISAEGAVETHRTMTPDDMLVWSGVHRDNGGWYAGGYDVSGWGVFRFRFEDNSWVRKATVEGVDSLWNPRFLTVDDVNGGYFVSLTEATYPAVFRIPEEGGPTATFFISDIRDNHFALWDLYARY